MLKRITPLLVFIVLYATLSAQKVDSLKHSWFVKNGSFYGSWGYNTERYTSSNLYVVQPGLNNNYVFNNVQAHDHIGWNNLFHVQPTIPQYNYRLGYFFNKKQDLAIELNFDHTKYVIAQGYYVNVTGTRNGQPVNESVYLSNTTLRYQLNNGANFFLFNIVKRLKIIHTHSESVVVNALGKAGVGPVVPHVDNTIFGEDNVRQFQFGGWNTGVEAVFQIMLFKHIYLEYCNKLDYARYSWLEIYQGRAHQNFGTYEMIANLGYTFHFNHKKYPQL